MARRMSWTPNKIPKDPKVRLKRQINLPYASSVMVGIIIGSGIFVSPTSFVLNCGSVALTLIMWVICGVLTLGIVLTYTELAGMYPKAGGEYLFYKEILGPFPAFLNAWVSFVAQTSAFYAICALTAANYMLKPFFPDCDVPVHGTKLLSVWILVTITVLNSISVKHVARFQFVFMISKLSALAMIVIGGMVQLANGKTEYLSSGFAYTTTNPASVSIALVSGVFTYGGWYYLFILVEEVKRPEKVVPQASVISMVIVIILYALTNVAYFTVLSPAEMAASPAVAVTFADRALGPVAVAIPIFVACSAIGSLNGSILGGSRKHFAAARDGLFPNLFAMIHIKQSTPLPSIWASCGLSCIYIIAGNAVTLIEYSGFVDTVVYGLSMYCVIYLKIKQPDLKRPISMPMFVPVVSLLLMVIGLVMALYTEPYRNGIGALIIVSGVPAYWLGVMWKSKPKCYRNIQGKTTTFVQKLASVLREDPENNNIK